MECLNKEEVIDCYYDLFENVIDIAFQSVFY
jgi:hypothetical protein